MYTKLPKTHSPFGVYKLYSSRERDILGGGGPFSDRVLGKMDVFLIGIQGWGYNFKNMNFEHISNITFILLFFH